MVSVLQIGSVGTELSKLVHEVKESQTQIVIEAEGKPVVAMVRYDYLTNLIAALEDALDSALLKKAVASNDAFFSFGDAIADHNMAHNVDVRVEDFTKV
jgi:hypothetical protein